MEPVDGQDVNRLNYYKENNIPHTYQCSICGDWRGEDKTKHAHRWVIRDLRPFQNVIGDVNENRTNSTGL